MLVSARIIGFLVAVDEDVETGVVVVDAVAVDMEVEVGVVVVVAVFVAVVVVPVVAPVVESAACSKLALLSRNAVLMARAILLLLNILFSLSAKKYDVRTSNLKLFIPVGCPHNVIYKSAAS